MSATARSRPGPRQAAYRPEPTGDCPDGTLLAAGQGGIAPSQTSNVAKVNPTTLKVQELIRHPDIEGFGVSTVAIQIANELWLGSVRGDRIAIFPLVQSTPSR